jgi:ATP-dependent RNA helicase DDX51/DBP6
VTGRVDGDSKKRKRDTEEPKKSNSKEKKHKTRAIAAAPAADNGEASDGGGLSENDVRWSAAQLQAESRSGAYEQAAAQEDGDLDVNAIFAKYSASGATRKPWVAKEGANGDAVAFADVDEQNGGGDEDALVDDYEAAAGAEAVFAKYRKSLTLSQKRQVKEAAVETAKEQSPELELHGLEPLPQPEKAPYIPYKATFSSLPAWISNPSAVQADATLPFDELKLSKRLAENLAKKNFTSAMAVQTAVLPLLLPGRDNYRGDICVSAPTGSGKTLSYVLPMIEHLHEKAMTRLRGLIVVPTRELVTQAREVAELCASGTGVKIGTAVGSVALVTEQAQLVKRSQRYDPEARQALDEEADKRVMLGYDKDDEMLKDIVDLLPGHIPEYNSAVDILICTPGRLVDHIRSTPGFTVEHTEWLVIDEADRLLDSNFQDWVDVVLPALETKMELDPRAKVLASLKERVAIKQIRKIILSATMTRDLSKLASLRLSRPTLVAVVEVETARNGEGDDEDAEDKMQKSEHATILPSLLKESAVPVGDGSEKPLYLLHLLSQHLAISSPETTVLIFCASDDNATRLARLLALLSPELEARTAVLTKSTSAPARRKLLASFASTGPDTLQLVISTDRTSRGLDVENLAFVVNYDIPPSVTSYVHRVGRTARAGRKGEAWTLVSDTEARWFWRVIARGKEINRGERVVERVRLGEAEEEMKESYQEALEKLGDAVHGR